MDDHSSLFDELGPAKIIQVHEPTIGLKAALVIDNVARGPAIGGLRMAPDVSIVECFRLARAMSLKNAAAGIPHGGGKSVLWGDSRMDERGKATLIRAFAHALRNESDYIFGPDMGTNEVCMAWIKDEIGRSVGLPAELGGIPLDEIGATGWGLLHAADVAAPYCGLRIESARCAIQGFGAVGKHAALFLSQRGATIVAASDSQATVCNPYGLDVEALREHKAQTGSLAKFPGGETHGVDAVIDVECDVWIPAARPDVITMANASRLRAKLVVQGANIPITAEAEVALASKEVLVLPDFIANAGGVICAAMEYAGATQASAMAAIESRIRENTRMVLEAALRDKVLPRAAAVNLAKTRIQHAMGWRRFGVL